MHPKTFLYGALTDRQQTQIINCVLVQPNEPPYASVDKTIFFLWQVTNCANRQLCLKLKTDTFYCLFTGETDLMIAWVWSH